MSDYDTEQQFSDGDPTHEGGAVTASWRHPVNVGQLVMGIAFAGMVVVWALIVGTDIPSEDLQWLMPIPWVSAGIAGLVAMALAARRRT